MKTKVYFRAEGNSTIGLGHVIRSLALADMLREEFDCHFIIRNQQENLKAQILEICETITFLPDSLTFEQEATYLSETLFINQDIIVLDGYNYTTAYQEKIKQKGCKLVCIDDIHAYHFVADVVINHAPQVAFSSYSTNVNTKVYSGLNYSLLRKPFLQAAGETRTINSIKKVFVCFGGSDINNITLKVLEALSQEELQIEQIGVVLGSANHYLDQIKSFSEAHTKPVIQIYNSLSASEMADLMKEHDLAIVPASSILYETIAVKMPVISGFYVDNQINIYQGFKDLGLIIGIGDFYTFDDYPKIIQELYSTDLNAIVERQASCKIGQAKTNFLNLFRSLEKEEKMDYSLRRAAQEDVLLYYQWASDPVVRQNAISQEEIKLEDHKKWFAKKVKAEDCFLYLLLYQNIPVGQIRFDLEGNIARIDYSVDREHRGKGLGSLLVDLGIAQLRTEEMTVDTIMAEVKEENIPSCKVFEKMIFKNEGHRVVGNITLKKYFKQIRTL